jgi:2'-5' RNA ligase
MRDKKDIRLFFALWPDEEVREHIGAFVDTIPAETGRVVPRYNWHMTLHFIGNTTFDEKACLDRQARKVQANAFDLTIDQTGFFKKSKVFWLGCENSPKALFDLQQNLGKKISQCEYGPETRPYSPHITVARKVTEKPEFKLSSKIPWYVDRFVLIESVSEPGGVRYRVVETYPLMNSPLTA